MEGPEPCGLANWNERQLITNLTAHELGWHPKAVVLTGCDSIQRRRAEQGQVWPATDRSACHRRGDDAWYPLVPAIVGSHDLGASHEQSHELPAQYAVVRRDCATDCD